MHICIFIHNKMQDKEDKRTLINEEALVKSAAMTFGPGGGEKTQEGMINCSVKLHFNTLLVDSFHAGRR